MPRWGIRPTMGRGPAVPAGRGRWARVLLYNGKYSGWRSCSGRFEMCESDLSGWSDGDAVRSSHQLDALKCDISPSVPKRPPGRSRPSSHSRDVEEEALCAN